MEHDEENLSFLQQHRFLILIAATIVIAIILVAISLYIYKASGAAQLDLSRPGYISVSSQTVNNDNGITDYSEIGPINSDTITQFKEQYDQQATSATSVDAFGGDPLDPNTLEFSQPTNQ
jgi:cbb3-type cytochrome oxidase subunit 3